MRYSKMASITAVFMVVAAGIGLQGCHSSAATADPRQADTLVRLGTVESSEGSARIFSGVVSARVQSNLGFRVSGKVVERLVDAGQTVRKGQPLMRLDRTDYENAIAAQQGSVAAARARLVQAEADEARYRELVESGAVSRSAYDEIKAAAESARALHSTAEAQFRVASDEGAYSTLVADADGTVVDTAAEPGQYVFAGQTVIRVARAGPREATIYLPETLRPSLGSAATVTLFGDQAQAIQYASRLRQLSDAADPQTRTYEARFVLDGAAATAPLGATVTVKLAGGNTGDVAVPLTAVTDKGQGSGVWIFNKEQSSVSFVKVQFVRLDGERAIVRGNIKGGESIVALGAHLLNEHQRVRIETTNVASN